jgi:uncharacterized protein
MRTGQADLPLHTGRAPRWLFERMVGLARAMSVAIVEEEGPSSLLMRLSDPYWFQAFGCVLGFDWHSSGLTTTTCGALKDGLRGIQDDVGIVVAGGKGRASRKTPSEIETASERWGLDPTALVRASRLSAKVDSSAVQDGYQVYQHTFAFAADGSWTVVQQGMNEDNGMARRYHWLTTDTFDVDPHAAVAGTPEQLVLNLVAGEAGDNRSTSVEVANEPAAKTAAEIARMRTLRMPRHHAVRLDDIDPTRIERILEKAYEAHPSSYTELVGVAGVGAKGLRALSLVAELTYGAPSSVRDPVSFSFAHGGKDGTPFPVDRKTYDSTIASLERAVTEARTGRSEKKDALKRLARLQPTVTNNG